MASCLKKECAACGERNTCQGLHAVNLTGFEMELIVTLLSDHMPRAVRERIDPKSTQGDKEAAQLFISLATSIVGKFGEARVKFERMSNGLKKMQQKQEGKRDDN